MSNPDYTEQEWLKRYREALVSYGLTEEEANGIDPEIDLSYDPEDAASDELYYMAQNATLERR